MLNREEFREYARKRARELNLPEKIVVPTAESFYKDYNQLCDEIQGFKEMDDVLNVIIKELALRPKIVVADKMSWKLLKTLLSEPHLWKRKLLS